VAPTLLDRAKHLLVHCSKQLAGSKMKRRTILLAGIGITGAAAATAWSLRNRLTRWSLTSAHYEQASLTEAVAVDSDLCFLTPEQVEGPYFVKAPLRKDIREDRNGIPLDLTLKLVSSDGCTPASGVHVEIWHCDSAGRYSGYPEDISRAPFDTMRLIGSPDGHVTPINGKTYLRGAQVTDADGQVSFNTILPGWYDPRIPHIHVKAFAGDDAALTTQLYFPEALTRDAFSTHPDYAPHGACPYHAKNDIVIGQDPDASGLLLKPVAQGNGLVASAMLGLRMQG